MRRKRKRGRRGVTAGPNSEKSAVFNDGDDGDSEIATHEYEKHFVMKGCKGRIHSK